MTAANAEPTSLTGHQVIELALSMLTKGTSEPVEIRGTDALRLERAIGCLETAQDLSHVVEELLHLARFLDLEKSSRTAAETVSRIAAMAADALTVVREGAQKVGDAVAQVAQRYRHFKADRPALAPMIGSKPPKDAIRAARFQPMRRV